MYEFFLYIYIEMSTAILLEKKIIQFTLFKIVIQIISIEVQIYYEMNLVIKVDRLSLFGSF